MIYLTPIG